MAARRRRQPGLIAGSSIPGSTASSSSTSAARPLEAAGRNRDNTTPHLIADMEKLRKHLGIDRWFVFGGSWGSTLALAYAEHHPERVRGWRCAASSCCRKSEIDWFLYGLREFAPEAWRAFAGHIPEDERGDLLAAYHGSA